MPVPFSEQPMLLSIFGPVRKTTMRVTVDFQQTIADIVTRYRPDLGRTIYVRARARLFHNVEVLELTDGASIPLAMNDLRDVDRDTLAAAARSSELRWCFTPLANMGDNPFPFNCEIIVGR